MEHHVCDVPTLRATDVYSGTNNREVIVFSFVSTTTFFCQYANHINIPTDNIYEIPVNMPDVTTRDYDYDPDRPVLDSCL